MRDDLVHQHDRVLDLHPDEREEAEEHSVYASSTLTAAITLSPFTKLHLGPFVFFHLTLASRAGIW